MEIRKCWVINRNGGEFLHIFGTRDEAVSYAEGLHRNDRKSIDGIYESFAGYTGGEWEELYSEDVPEMSTSWGIKDGESLSDEELEEVKT
jgi:hypothetical protein